MQLSRCDRVRTHRMRNLTQVLNTAHAWRGLACVTGLNSSLTCLHMRVYTWVFFPRLRQQRMLNAAIERRPGDGHVYPLALVYGSSGVRGQGHSEASAGESGVEWGCSEHDTVMATFWMRRLPLYVRKHNYAARAVHFVSLAQEQRWEDDTCDDTGRVSKDSICAFCYLSQTPSCKCCLVQFKKVMRGKKLK